jgi:hypothetical protein
MIERIYILSDNFRRIARDHFISPAQGKGGQLQASMYVIFVVKRVLPRVCDLLQPAAKLARPEIFALNRAERRDIA